MLVQICINDSIWNITQENRMMNYEVFHVARLSFYNKNFKFLYILCQEAKYIKQSLLSNNLYYLKVTRKTLSRTSAAKFAKSSKA